MVGEFRSDQEPAAGNLSTGSPAAASQGPALPIDTEACGDLSLRIGRDGSWYYRDSKITRLPLVRLFASVMRRGEDGGYWLVTPVERGRLVVDDVPFVAVEMKVRGRDHDQVLSFRSTLDEWVDAGIDGPIFLRRQPGGEMAPYVMMRPGLEARIERAVYYDLVELGEECGREFGVWSAGRFFSLGSIEDA